jgi:hypothetical protein
MVHTSRNEMLEKSKIRSKATSGFLVRGTDIERGIANILDRNQP